MYVCICTNIHIQIYTQFCLPKGHEKQKLLSPQFRHHCFFQKKTWDTWHPAHQNTKTSRSQLRCMRRWRRNWPIPGNQGKALRRFWRCRWWKILDSWCWKWLFEPSKLVNPVTLGRITDFCHWNFCLNKKVLTQSTIITWLRIEYLTSLTAWPLLWGRGLAVQKV